MPKQSWIPPPRQEYSYIFLLFDTKYTNIKNYLDVR